MNRKLTRLEPFLGFFLLPEQVMAVMAAFLIFLCE